MNWRYTQYGPIKNSRIKNQHSDFEKNKEPVVIHYLKNKVGVVDFANAQGVVMF